MGVMLVVSKKSPELNMDLKKIQRMEIYGNLMSCSHQFSIQYDSSFGLAPGPVFFQHV